MIIDNENATNDNRTASLRYCLIRSNLLAPMHCLTPTSFVLSIERADVRFIKFIHAIKRIKAAIIENIYT